MPRKPKTKPAADVTDRAKNLLDEMTRNSPGLKRLVSRLNSPKGRGGMALAAIGIAGAVFYMNYDSNKTTRMYADISRVSNLQQLSLTISHIYAEQKQLPESLKDIEQRPNPMFQRDQYMYDTATFHPFEYKRLGDKTYQLCATFEFSTVQTSRLVPGDMVNPTWAHAPGHHCFTLDVDGSLVPDPAAQNGESAPAIPAPLDAAGAK